MSDPGSGAEIRDVALLLDEEALPRWLAAAVERMVADADVSVVRLVINREPGGRGPRETAVRLAELREWAPVATALELRGPPEHAESVPVGEVDALADAERTYCVPQPRDGFGTELPAHAVDRLAETDLAVRAGFGILLGDALDAPTHGVLSFHHGDMTRYRGQPAGFWEWLHDEPEGGITVQRIAEELDAGEVVAYRDVDIADAPTWGEVRRRLYTQSEDMLARAVRNLRDPDVETASPDSFGDLYRLPKGKPVATYVAKTARAYLP